MLVFERGHLRFSHPLLASTVYASRPPAERSRIHLLLAGSVDDSEERGRHLALGTEIPDRSVAQLSTRPRPPREGEARPRPPHCSPNTRYD